MVDALIGLFREEKSSFSSENCQTVVFIFAFLLIVGSEFSRLTGLVCTLARYTEREAEENGRPPQIGKWQVS